MINLKRSLFLWPVIVLKRCIWPSSTQRRRLWESVWRVQWNILTWIMKKTSLCEWRKNEKISMWMKAEFSNEKTNSPFWACLPLWDICRSAIFCDPKGKPKRITEISTLTAWNWWTNVTNLLLLILNFIIC